MPVESAADRAIFVDPDEFGTAAVYTPSGGTAAALNGVFDEAYESAFGSPGAGVVQPVLVVRTADLPEGAAFGEFTGDRVAIGDRTFVPRAAEPDGTGMTRLILEEED